MPDPRPPHDDADEPEIGREPRAGDGAPERDASGGRGDGSDGGEGRHAGRDGPPRDDEARRAEEAAETDEAAEYVADAGDEDGEDGEDAEEMDDLLPQEGHRVVFVSTAVPVQISVAPLDDERAPEGSALGAYIGQRLVARCAMPPEALERLMELDLFSEPVPLALLAVEEDPGLQCRLFALVPAERIADAQHEHEPWKASVPSFEDAVGDDDGDDDEDGELVGGGEGAEGDDEEDEDDAVASILLGHIVRFQRDRKFADDLTAEAVDVLQKIVLGGTLEDANAKAVDDFLNSL